MHDRPHLTPQRINADLLRFTFQTSTAYWVTVGLLALGVAAGAVCVALIVINGQEQLGYSNTQMWAVLITNFIFWTGISHAGVVISSALRLSEAEWRRPITRAAEVLSAFALMVAALFPVLHTGRMWRTAYWVFPYDFSRNLWPNIRSVLIWDVTAVLTYLLGVSLFVYVVGLPDLAVARDHAHGRRRAVYRALALGFTGTTRQWALQRSAGLLLAALLLVLFLVDQSIVAWDFSLALVPGWHSTAFAPYFVAGAIHSSLGAMAVVMALLRRVLHAEAYLTPEHFDALGRFQVVAALGWIFFALCNFLLGVASRDPLEWAVWELRLLTPPYSVLTIIVLLSALVVPLPLWLSRRVRRAPMAMLALGVSVNVGMWLERFLLVVPPLSHKQAFVFTWVTGYELRLIEVVLTLATFTAAGLGILLLGKLLPLIPIVDVKEGEARRRYVRVGRARVPAVIRDREE